MDCHKRNFMETITKPQLEDFYNSLDPRGISTSEYNEYLKALVEWDAFVQSKENV